MGRCWPWPTGDARQPKVNLVLWLTHADIDRYDSRCGRRFLGFGGHCRGRFLYHLRLLRALGWPNASSTRLCKSSQMPPESHRVDLHRLWRRGRDAIDRAAAWSHLET